MEPQRVRLAIHGGAGTIERSNMTPEREREYRAGLERALKAGYEILERGGSSLDATEAAVRVLEDDPHFNAGKGSVFTSAGTNEMDAAIMDGKTLAAGAVASLKHVKNPIGLARLVMEKSGHVMMDSDGAELFAKNCMVCHQWRGEGHRVGPDLSGVAGRPRQALLVDILDPNKEVAPDYQSFLLVTKRGQIATGLIAEETAAAVRLRRGEGAEETVLRTEIEELRATGRSLMPEGLEQGLTVRESRCCDFNRRHDK